MTSQRDPRDPIDEMLMREPHLDDAGFTERVLARLPPPRRGLRPAVLFGSAAIAAALAASFLPAALRDLFAALSAWHPPALGPGAATAAIAALGAFALSGLVVAWDE
jgi:hypothetical protein